MLRHTLSPTNEFNPHFVGYEWIQAALHSNFKIRFLFASRLSFELIDDGGKIALCVSWKAYGGEEISLQPLTLAVDGVGGQLFAQVDLPRGKSLVALSGRLVGAQSQRGHLEEDTHLLHFPGTRQLCRQLIRELL